MTVRYPIGIQSFSELRQLGYVYVDKTARVYELTHHVKYHFLSRPRRFGKSLLISTIEAYFKGQKELFEGLAIAALEKEWLEYPVFHLDLSGVSYQEKGALSDKLDSALSGWESQYGVTCNAKTDGVRFSNVIKQAKQKTGRGVVLLVDEYEKPILDTIGNPDLQDAYRSQLNGFYGVIKGSDANLRFVLFTGVTKIGKMSIFSALNNLNDLAFAPRFATLCGITEQELQQVFHTDIHALAEYMNISDEEVSAQLKKKYDGYHFTANGIGVYNPFSLLNAFYNQKLSNYWFSTGTPSFLVELFRKQQFVLEDLENCMRTEDQLKDIDSYQRDAIPLFYQSGYLTLKSGEDEFGRIKLGFPNEEVERGMLDFFIPFYCKSDGTTEFHVSYFVEDVRNANIESFMTRISSLLADTTYEVDRALEVHFQNFFYLLFKLMGFYVEAEYRTSVGRIDMVIKTDRYIYIIEFKLGRSAKLALNQIKKNHYVEPFMSDPRKKYLVGANFSTKLRGMGKFVIEEM